MPFARRCAARFRQFAGPIAGALSVVLTVSGLMCQAAEPEGWKAELLKQPIRAFCIDFNWQNFPDGRHVFAEPGHWADADPAEHIAWYKAIGANVIQTFAVSINGYAWYKGGPVPEQPGLKHDFLTEMVRLGHKEHMLVIGYWCTDGRTQRQLLPTKGYEDFANRYRVPLTNDYNDYLCASIVDALRKTDMDGFMIDCFRNFCTDKWFDIEKQMYVELMGKPFPGADKITKAEKAKYNERAVQRTWKRVRNAARQVKPDCILWVNGPQHARLKGLDWVLNEGNDPRQLEKTKALLGNDTRVRLIQNLVGLPSNDARSVLAESKYQRWDYYGYAAPYDNSLPLPVADYLSRPIDSFVGKDRTGINDRNLAVLARFYRGLRMDDVILGNSGTTKD